MSANETKENIARFGMAVKGVVYSLVGVLTVMSALGQGGKKTGKEGTIQFIADQSYGQVILIVLAAGLASYVFYRLYQAIADPADRGSDWKGLGYRVSYVGSAALYGFLAYYTLKILIGSGSSSGGSGNKGLVAQLLSQPFGQFLVAVVGIVFLVKAGIQFYRAYSGSYRKKIERTHLNDNVRTTILTAGKVGYTARGIVLGVIAYLILKASITADSSEAGGTEDAFHYVQNEFGTLVMILIATGILAYGVFTFIRARYPGVSLTK